MNEIGVWPRTVLSATSFKDSSNFNVSITSTEPMGQGGTSIVIRGNSVGKTGALNTHALKIFKAVLSLDEEARLLRELRIVQLLAGQHRHILPYIGSAVHIHPPTKLSHLVLIAPYMKHGDLFTYLKRKPSADRLTFILQIADAVSFLHDQCGVVHGDLKCENVLVSDDHDAVLADFGLSTIVNKGEEAETTATQIRAACSFRFAAPEILLDTATSTSKRVRSKTTMTDVYAFGMLILQTFSGKRPWPNCNDPEIYGNVLISRTPHPHPGESAVQGGFTERCWKTCLSCWRYDPQERPSIQGVKEMLFVRATLSHLGHGLIWAIEKPRAVPGQDIRAYQVDIHADDVQVYGLFSAISRDATLTARSFNNSQQFTVTNIASVTVGYGATAQVYRGDACFPSGAMVPVAVKVITSLLDRRKDAIMQELYRREVELVARVRHRYVLPVLGEMSMGLHRALVSPFMHNGHLLEYVRKYPETDCCSLIVQIAEAIEYLHIDAGIVHGDLKCNVLISRTGEARLIDFGLGTFRSASYLTTTSDIRGIFSIPFAAPELLFPREREVGDQPRSKTTESDVYAFAMLILQAFQRGPPWKEMHESWIVGSLMAHKLPPRPQGISNSWWEVCVQCFSSDPASRPAIQEVRRGLLRHAPGFEDLDELFVPRPSETPAAAPV